MDSKNPVLEQAKFFRRKQCFEITPDYNLLVAVIGVSKLEKFIIPRRGLNPNPTRIRHFDLKPLILVIPFTLIAIPFLGVAIWAFSQGKFGWGPLFIGGGFGVVAVIFLLGMYGRAIDALLYTGPIGARIPLWFNNPNRDAFEAFAKALEKSIEAAQLAQPTDGSMSSEIMKLKDLLDKGVLTPEQFESGKNKILGLDNRRIGF